MVLIGRIPAYFRMKIRESQTGTLPVLSFSILSLMMFTSALFPKRSLDERFILLVLRVCDDFLHYIDLPVSLRIKVIKQFVKEDEDKPSTVAASRLARSLFSALSAGGS